jgi:uncharacterized protein (DUF952 family)
MAEPVYKVMTQAAFEDARRAGRFSGSADDLRDGFIHLSAAHQLAGTLASYFSAQAGLLLLAIDADRLGADLKWECSRGGALFPHLYTQLDLGAILWVEQLALTADGVHILPQRIAA